MNLYARLADALVLMHLAFVAFVVLGQVGILAGIALRKPWARNLTFRSIHLVCIGVVAAEGMLDIECPITVWERNLRFSAGEEVSNAPFIPRMANRILFYPGIPHSYFEWGHIGFGAMVFLTFILWPPKFRKVTPPRENLSTTTSRPS